MPEESAGAIDISRTVKKWSGKRGSLIMMLHDIQGQCGYVPRDVALQLAEQVDVPLAQIYEVLTFYNYFKTSLPGKAVVSVCTGTACHLKGAPELMSALSEELGIADGETTEDGNFHLQSVRCVGCCGLAPVVMVNAQTYGKVKPAEIRGIIGRWQDTIDSGEL